MRPTPRAAIFAGLGGAGCVLVVLVAPELWLLGLAAPAATLLAVGLDAVTTLRRHQIAIDADVPGAVLIGETDALRLVLTPAGGFSGCRCWIRCEVSPLMTQPDPVSAWLEPGQAAETALPLTPLRRGRGRVEQLWLRWPGPFGLVERIHSVDLAREIDIVPNTRVVRHLAFNVSARDAPVGSRPDRHPGEGTEFAALREYVQGMDHRAIDWKHSARHRRLVCKEFQSERSQQIVFAFDSGYLMGEPMDGVPRLDHAISAALLMAYLSLRAGDRVGTFSFDSTVRHYTRPAAGIHAFAQIQRDVAGIGYHTDETNFTLGLSTLQGHLVRRSLIIVMTDFVDSVMAELMLQTLQRLATRHLVLFVTLRNPELTAAASAEPTDIDVLSRSVVAEGFLRDRQVVFERLRRLGVLCLEAPRDRIGIALINQYLAIKDRGQI